MNGYEDPAPDVYDGDKLRKCKLCGGDAWEATPWVDWQEKELECVRITCLDCGHVDVWAFKKETENGTYDETLRLAQARWNDLME